MYGLRKPRSTLSCLVPYVEIREPFAANNCILSSDSMVLDAICDFVRDETTEPESIKNLMLLDLSRMCRRFSLLLLILFSDLLLLLGLLIVTFLGKSHSCWHLCEELPNLI